MKEKVYVRITYIRGVKDEVLITYEKPLLEFVDDVRFYLKQNPNMVYDTGNSVKVEYSDSLTFYLIICNKSELEKYL